MALLEVIVQAHKQGSSDISAMKFDIPDSHASEQQWREWIEINRYGKYASITKKMTDSEKAEFESLKQTVVKKLQTNR